MIQPVEGLGAEGNAMAFLDDEVFKQSEVVILEAWTIDNVAYAVGHDRAVGRFSKDRRAVRIGDVEPEALISLDGSVVACDANWPVNPPELRTAARADAREVVTRSHAGRRAGLHLRYGC